MDKQIQMGKLFVIPLDGLVENERELELTEMTKEQNAVEVHF